MQTSLRRMLHSPLDRLVRAAFCLALSALTVALPAALEAQSDSAKSRDSSTVSAQTIGIAPKPSGPPMANGPQVAPVALTHTTPFAPATLPPADDNINVGQNVAMMVVGAAAVVTGVIIGGNGGGAIAVTGGVVGLVGLYRYLR